MKILFIGISGYQYPHTRVRCYHFAEGLRKFGLQTEVLSYKDHLAASRSEAEMYELTDGVKVWLNIKALPKLLKEKKTIFYIQKIHYHSAGAYLCYRLGRNKYIFDYDDYDVDLSCLFSSKYLNKIFFGSTDFAEITREVAKNAVGCIAASRFLFEYLKKINPLTFYIPTGVDTEKFFPLSKKNSDKIVFMWTGIIWGEIIFENIKFVIECFKDLIEHFNYKNVELHIVGGGRWFPKVEELINTPLFSRIPIKLITWINHQQMPNILANADVGLFPLIQKNLWTIAKSPTKLFEFMAMGLPTIVSDTGELTHVIQHGVDGFLAKNKQEWVFFMKRLIEEPRLRNEIGSNARKKVEKEFSLYVLSERLYSIFQQLFRC